MLITRKSKRKIFKYFVADSFFHYKDVNDENVKNFSRLLKKLFHYKHKMKFLITPRDTIDLASLDYHTYFFNNNDLIISKERNYLEDNKDNIVIINLNRNSNNIVVYYLNEKVISFLKLMIDNNLEIINKINKIVISINRKKFKLYGDFLENDKLKAEIEALSIKWMNHNGSRQEG